MDSMVEENGSVNSGVDPLAPTSDSNSSLPIVSSVQTSSGHHLVAATNIVQLTLPTHTQAQVRGQWPLAHSACDSKFSSFSLLFHYLLILIS